MSFDLKLKFSSAGAHRVLPNIRLQPAAAGVIMRAAAAEAETLGGPSLDQQGAKCDSS